MIDSTTSRRWKSAARVSGVVAGALAFFALGDLLELFAYLLVPITWIPAVRRRLEAGGPAPAPGIESVRTRRPAPAAPPETDVTGESFTLRDGLTGLAPGKAVITFAVVGGILAVATCVAAPLAGLPSWTPYVAVPVVVLATAVGVVLMLAVLFGLSEVTVTIGRHRLALRYGSVSTIIVERAEVGSGRAGRRTIRLRDAHGRRRLLLPVHRHRADVLAALHAHGWPVTELS